MDIPGFAAKNSGRAQVANLGLASTLNNSTVNDARLVYLRDVALSGRPIQGTGVALASLFFNTPWNSTGGMGSVDPSLVGVPNFDSNNYSFGLPPGGRNQYNNTVQAIDNVTKIIHAWAETLLAGECEKHIVPVKQATVRD